MTQIKKSIKQYSFECLLILIRHLVNVCVCVYVCVLPSKNKDFEVLFVSREKLIFSSLVRYWSNIFTAFSLQPLSTLSNSCFSLFSVCFCFVFVRPPSSVWLVSIKVVFDQIFVFLFYLSTSVQLEIDSICYDFLDNNNFGFVFFQFNEDFRGMFRCDYSRKKSISRFSFLPLVCCFNCFNITSLFDLDGFVILTSSRLYFRIVQFFLPILLI